MSGLLSTYAGGGGRWTTNPRQLGKVSVVNTVLNLKTAYNTSSNSNAGAFYTALALRGAQASIVSANTYVTVANLTGAGFLVNCVSPTHTAAFTPTIRITVDGVQYTLTPSAAQTAAYRMLLGPFNPGPGAAVGDSTYVNGASDYGFVGASVGGLSQVTSAVTIALPTPELALALGMQVLRFESSLLIEMKCDLLSANAVDKQCGASYVLDL